METIYLELVTLEDQGAGAHAVLRVRRPSPPNWNKEATCVFTEDCMGISEFKSLAAILRAEVDELEKQATKFFENQRKLRFSGKIQRPEL